MNDLIPISNSQLNKKLSKESDKIEGPNELKIANNSLDMNTGENFAGMWKSKHK